MVLRSTLNFRANSLLLIFIFTFSINSLSFGKSVRLEMVNSELISIAICIIFTSDKLCNNLSQLYIVIQSLLYILKLSFIAFACSAYFNPRTRVECDTKEQIVMFNYLYFNPRTRVECD